MQITNSYNSNSNITITPREAPAPVSNNTSATTTTQEVPVNNPVVSELTNTQLANINAPDSMRYEVTELLQQFVEWIRVSTDSKRMEFLYNILLKENHETSDLFGKIMDIARRIMNGEEVTLEEMRFLQEQNPQLLYVVILLKEDSAEADGRERRRDRDRRGRDRRAGARRREYGLRSHSQPELREARAIERMNYTVPRELTRQVNSLLVKKSLKKSYETTSKGKTLSISINTVVSNPHDIAT